MVCVYENMSFQALTIYDYTVISSKGLAVLNPYDGCGFPRTHILYNSQCVSPKKLEFSD